MSRKPNLCQPDSVGPWLRLCVCWGFAATSALAAAPKAAAQAPPPMNPPAAPVIIDDQRPATALPAPRPLDPPPAWLTVPPKPSTGDRVLGTMPKPTAKTAEKIKQYFDTFIEPEANLTLISGQTRLLILKETPKKIQVANEGILDYNMLNKDQMLLQGRAVGTTIMTFWFPDPKDANKEEILTFFVSTLPDPGVRERLERSYKTLQDQINCAFPDSVICLHLVGDKVIVTGQAKDIAEVNKIMTILRSNGQGGGGGGGGRGRRGSGGGGAGISSNLPTDRIVPEHNPNDPTDVNGQPINPGTDSYVQHANDWIINMIRIPGEQTVNLNVTIAEVNRAATRSIGMNFTLLNNEGQAVFNQSTGSIMTGGLTRGSVNSGLGVSAALAGGANFIPTVPGVTPGSGGFNNIQASIDNGQVRLAISALRNLSYAKFLAEPNVTVINGQQATFKSGGQFPLPVVANSGGGGNLTGVQFQPYGVNVTFTPYITDRDRIRMVLDADITAISQTVSTTNISGAQIPNFNQRKVNTTVEMRDGQTLAVAGLIQNDWTADSHRIPFFGDLPIVGNFAKFDRVSAGEQELIMLVTPELVHPIDCKTRMPLPGADIFEPTDVEFYLYGRLESHGQTDYRSPIMTDWQRIRNFRNMESNYISGPSGYTQQGRASVIGP